MSSDSEDENIFGDEGESVSEGEEEEGEEGEEGGLTESSGSEGESGSDIGSASSEEEIFATKSRSKTPKASSSKPAPVSFAGFQAAEPTSYVPPSSSTYAPPPSSSTYAPPPSSSTYSAPPISSAFTPPFMASTSTESKSYRIRGPDDSTSNKLILEHWGNTEKYVPLIEPLKEGNDTHEIKSGVHTWKFAKSRSKKVVKELEEIFNHGDEMLEKRISVSTTGSSGVPQPQSIPFNPSAYMQSAPPPSSKPPPINVTPCTFNSLFIASCVMFDFAFVRLIFLPAPCEAELIEFSTPLPFTINPGAVIEPGIIPSTSFPAGVAPLR